MQTLTFEMPRDLTLRVTSDEFAAIAAANQTLKLERTANGELLLNPPTGGESGRRNIKIGRYLDQWTDQYGGVCFDSSSGFELPNGAIRSPDAAWISSDRWDALTQDEKDGFVPLCPDFVVELRSKTDTLSTLQGKMREYIDNGAQLGWLVDPQGRQVEIYGCDRKTITLKNPNQISGENILPGFTLDLRQLWD